MCVVCVCVCVCVRVCVPSSLVCDIFLQFVCVTVRACTL